MPRKQNITSEHYNKILPTRLRDALKARGLLPGTLAEQIGVQRQAVNYYLNGDRVPDAERLAKIAAALGVSCDYLLGLSKVPAIEADIKAAAEYTGLSSDAIKTLNSLKEAGASDSATMINILLQNTTGAEHENILPIMLAYYKGLGANIEVDNALVRIIAKHNIDIENIDDIFSVYESLKNIDFFVDGQEGYSFTVEELYLQGLKDKMLRKLEDLKTGGGE